MKKEIVFAVVIGLVIGLIITFGMYRARQAMTGSSTVNPQLSASPLPSGNTANKHEPFLVSEPADESIVADATLRVSGQAFPNAAIVILNGASETVGMADDKGNFSLTLALVPGANVLTIRAMSDARATLEVIRTVVFSTADLSATPVPTFTPKPSPSPSAKPTTKPKASATPKPL